MAVNVKAQDSVTVYDFNDISKVRTWYKLVPRTSSAPTVAANVTEAQMTSNGWTTTEPAVDTTKKLYTVQQNVFGDGSYVWGDVSLSSSYEAAIEAYNKASAAEGAANETAKYFWFNSTDSGAGEGAGAHITEKTKEAFIADPSNGGGNILIDDNSMDIRDGTNVLATFGETVQIGGDNDARVVMSPLKTELLTNTGDAYFSADPTSGGTRTMPASYVVASNRTMTVTTQGMGQKYMIIADVGESLLSLIDSGVSFTITLKISHYHKPSASSGGYEKILERTVQHTFTKGTEEQFDDSTYSISTNPDYFHYDVRIYNWESQVRIVLWNFERTDGTKAYYYRVSLDEATLSITLNKDIPLIYLGGTANILGDLTMGLDSNGTSSSRATSGYDKDLFNAIYDLGWYSEVIV